MTMQTLELNETTVMPMVGFGTYLISDEMVPMAVSTAIQNGYRHIDTAAGYQNETGVGAGIREALSANGLQRDDVFITTKLWPGNAAWGDAPKTYDQTVEAFEESLAKLDTDFVDLYLIHAPSGGDERLDQWRALLDLKSAGKARAVGVSNFTTAHLDEINDAGLPEPDANQIELHPWSQKPELIAHMNAHGIAPIAYSSLAPLSTWRTEPGQDSAKTEDMKGQSAPFKALAQKYNTTEAQLLLRWGVQNGYAVLPKSLNSGRMQQNIDLFSFRIEDSDMADIQAMDRGEALAWATGDPSMMG
ncbi:MAG: aldo/keto reductase [Boseongicola sp.]|nr:MAG: aldo/keto reductase [Boseongicola sp.]